MAFAPFLVALILRPSRGSGPADRLEDQRPCEEEESGTLESGPVSFYKKEVDLYPHQIPYERADLNLPSSSVDSVRIYEAVPRLIEKEGPVSRHYIMEKTKEALGQKRLGTKLRSEVELAISDTAKVTEICGSEPFYYPSGTNVDAWPYYRVDKSENKRDLTDICYTELSNAFSDIIYAQGRMSTEDLIKQTALMFGFENLGEKRKAHLRGAIRFAIDRRHELHLDEQGYIYIS